jgi:Na+:H+ antiporter, NhaA family
LAELARVEVVAGIILAAAVAVALLWANGPFQSSYDRLWLRPLSWAALPSAQFHDVADLVNDGLMTVFFLVVGLEIGRERAVGSLRELRNAVLPVVAALGGMAGAAGIYLAVCELLGAGSLVRSGWGIPMATDIAFTLGGLALLGRRVPVALRVFVLALAVADDVASVVVLAIVSSAHVAVLPLLGAVGVLVAVVVVRRRVPHAVWPYLVALVVMWWLLARAGVEPTLAGAFVGILVPCLGTPTRPSASARLERVAHPLPVFVVLPLFVLANSGVVLSQQLFDDRSSRQVVLAVVAARLLGKIIGILLAVGVLVWLGVARLPDGVRWSEMAGAAACCGMGFTVPLLFAESAFAGHPLLIGAAQIALLLGSALALAIGGIVLVASARRRAAASTSADNVSH